MAIQRNFQFPRHKVRWNLTAIEFGPRYKIAPSQSVPVIVNGERGHEAKLMKWGLVPSWSPDPSIGNRMINARAETLLETSFKRLVSERRCIIPGKGYLKVERIWLEPLEGIDT